MNFPLICLHYPMLSDSVRMKAYKKAIFKAVKKGFTVCDIGAGSGILSFLCAQAGAKKIFAIEEGNIIDEAKEIAKLNGLSSKIRFFKGHSTDITLPQKVDLVVSELIGTGGINEGINESLLDAKKRFLKPGGIMLPKSLELFFVPVTAKEFWKVNMSFWDNVCGFDYRIKRPKVSAMKVMKLDDESSYLAIPEMISNVDFSSFEKIPHDFEANFKIKKDGPFHGLLGFFNSELYRGVELSNSPRFPETHWKQALFPCKDEIRVKKNDILKVNLKAFRALTQFYWRWTCKVERKGKEIASFTFDNLKLDKESILFGREGFKPNLNEDGSAENMILSLCNGNRTFDEIAKLLQKKMPKKFLNLKSALKNVKQILGGKIKA